MYIHIQKEIQLLTTVTSGFSVGLTGIAQQQHSPPPHGTVYPTSGHTHLISNCCSL